jgi:hypothetical protein
MIPRRPLLCSTCKSSQQRAEALSVSSACPLDLLPLIEASVDSYLVPTIGRINKTPDPASTPSAYQREQCLIDEVANLREGLLAEFHAR